MFVDVLTAGRAKFVALPIDRQQFRRPAARTDMKSELAGKRGFGNAEITSASMRARLMFAVPFFPGKSRAIEESFSETSDTVRSVE